MVLYYSFDRWDVRSDSIRDMISTFFAQITNYHPRLTKSVDFCLNDLHNQRGWTEIDLIQFFELFRKSLEVEQVIYVINHFDECTKESRKNFLDNFIYRSQMEEAPWKVVVTSQKPGALEDELSGPFCVPINLTVSGLEAHNIDMDIVELSKLRPDLTSQDSKVRQELMYIRNLEGPVREIICEQAMLCREWPDGKSIQQIFHPLDLTQTGDQGDKVLQNVLDWVLKNFPKQTILRRLFAWLLYSARPLTIWELATVLSFGSDQDQGGVAPGVFQVESLASNIQKWLPGIIKLDYNEVRFRHPRLHHVMVEKESGITMSGGAKYLWEEIRETAHSDIVDLCLKYLSRPSVRDLIDKTFQDTGSENLETPTFPDRTNLVSYAVQAWTHHFSLASSRPDLSSVLSLPESNDLEKTLARGYWALENPFTKSSACLDTLFPIFAGLGLPEVVKPRDQEEAFRGLLEAACKGQSKAVSNLLAEYKFSEDQLLEALKAASYSGEEDMMLGFLTHITAESESPGDIPWPPALIYRASWLDLDRFTDKILALGASPDPEVEWASTPKVSPLFQASRTGHSKTVQALVKHGANVEFVDHEDWMSLHIAAAKGHAEVARVLVEEGNADIEARSMGNFTPLYFAGLFGHYTAVQQLLKLGADPNMSIKPGLKDESQSPWLPLARACDGGFEQCVRLLLDKNASPNVSQGEPPLKWAASGGHLKICDMLLDAGADPRSELIDPPILAQIGQSSPNDAKLKVLDRFLELGLDVNAKGIKEGVPILVDIAGSYPITVKEGQVLPLEDHQRDIVMQKLLDSGADPNIPNSDGQGALHLATNERRYGLTKLLLEKGADVNKEDKTGRTPMFSALEDPELTRLLLEKGADSNLGSARGQTPLMYAAESGCAEAVKLLLEYNASIETEYNFEGSEDGVESFSGCTALSFAVSRGHANIVRVLAEAGANLKRKAIDPFYIPVIHEAARGEVLPVLLEFSSRIDVDQLDSHGDTALHLRDLPFENFKLLVNHGANIEAEDNRGSTPLSRAAAATDNCMERVKYLVKRGANVNHGSQRDGAALHEACLKGNFDVIKFLVENGADVNQTSDWLTGTPLQSVCWGFGDTESPQLEEIARYLLDEEEEHSHVRPKEWRADVTIKAGFLGYAINVAAFMRTPSMINLILDQKGATVDVRDDMGRMPIHFAALHSLDNFQAILDRGGDIGAKDKVGRTALHWAAHGGLSRVVEKIISLLSDKTAISDPDIDGWTPLCWAVRTSTTGLLESCTSETRQYEPVIKLLLEHGAGQTVEATFRDGKRTPLDIARLSGCSTEILRLLGDAGVGPGDAKREREAEEKTQQRERRTKVLCSGCQSVSRSLPSPHSDVGIIHASSDTTS